MRPFCGPEMHRCAHGLQLPRVGLLHHAQQTRGREIHEPQPERRRSGEVARQRRDLLCGQVDQQPLADDQNTACRSPDPGDQGAASLDVREVELDASLGLPAWKLFAIQNLGYGTNAKMMLGFNGPMWLRLGSNGQSYSDLTNHQNTWETNPIRATSAHAVLTDYSGGDRGARLDPRRLQTEASRFLGDLDKVYPGALAAATRDARGDFLAHLEHWPSNPLTKGAYTCNQPGYFTTIADNEQKPVGNLFFAGEHTSSFYEWQGFMEGGAVSGLRAAAEVLRAL